jgi:hypothetical protein
MPCAFEIKASAHIGQLKVFDVPKGDGWIFIMSNPYLKAE